MTKDSPYSFASVLFVYLMGIALGSLAISRLWSRLHAIRKRDLLFVLQLATGLYAGLCIIAYYHLTQKTPLAFFTRTSFALFPHPHLPQLGRRDAGLLSSIYGSLDILLWPALFLLVPTDSVRVERPYLDECRAGTTSI